MSLLGNLLRRKDFTVVAENQNVPKGTRLLFYKKIVLGGI